MDGLLNQRNRLTTCLPICAAISVLIASAAPARADVKGIVRDILGIESAGEKVQTGMSEMALTLRETTNQLGALVSDLHSGTSEQKKRAREVFEGILGRKIEEDDMPKIGLSIMVTTPPNSGPPLPLHVDMWPAGTDADEWVTLRLLSRRNTSFIQNPLNTASLTPVTPENVRRRVHNAAIEQVEKLERGRVKSCLRKGASASAGVGIGATVKIEESALELCRERARAETLAEVVLKLWPEPEAIEASTVFTAQVPGGFFSALIAREDELRQIIKERPGSKVEAWLHDFDNPEKRIGAFSRTNWWSRLEDWVKTCQDTGAVGVGRICWIFVDLKLVTMSEYYQYIEGLKREKGK
ncbi:MAG: hypothetical protein IV094_01155 [Vitreoscilla sp.]|nr:hypothetical protein [Vitreoscilla sp.]